MERAHRTGGHHPTVGRRSGCDAGSDIWAGGGGEEVKNIDRPESRSTDKV